MTKKAWIVLYLLAAAFVVLAYVTTYRPSPPVSQYQPWPLSYAKCFKLYQIPYSLSTDRESLLVRSDLEYSVISGCT